MSTTAHAEAIRVTRVGHRHGRSPPDTASGDKPSREPTRLLGNGRRLGAASRGWKGDRVRLGDMREAGVFRPCVPAPRQVSNA
jgi:hypothetical protein